MAFFICCILVLFVNVIFFFFTFHVRKEKKNHNSQNKSIHPLEQLWCDSDFQNKDIKHDVEWTFFFFWIICRMNLLYMDGWDGYLSHKSWEVPLYKLKAILYTISMWYKTFVCMSQNTMDFLNIIPNYKIELSEMNRQKCFRSLQVFCEILCIEIHHDWTTKICSKWPSLWLQFKGI